jgi:hypothetical protein
MPQAAMPRMTLMLPLPADAATPVCHYFRLSISRFFAFISDTLLSATAFAISSFLQLHDLSLPPLFTPIRHYAFAFRHYATFSLSFSLFVELFADIEILRAPACQIYFRFRPSLFSLLPSIRFERADMPILFVFHVIRCFS